MKTLIASALTAIALAGSASAMVIQGDNLPHLPGGASQFSTSGELVEKLTDNKSNSPAGDYSADNTITASVFEGNPQGVTGAWAR